MLYWCDIVGTFFFCVSGALAGRQMRMDYLGIFLMALITGTGGGSLRSMLLGDYPVPIFRQPEYMLVAVVAVPVATVFWHFWEKFTREVSVVDALGLGIFACVGAQVGDENGLAWWGCMMMGMVTATFGGVIRDVIRNEVPLIFRKEIYATAALLGAGLMLMMENYGAPRGWAIAVASLFTAVVRLVALRYALHSSGK